MTYYYSIEFNPSNKKLKIKRILWTDEQVSAPKPTDGWMGISYHNTNSQAKAYFNFIRGYLLDLISGDYDIQIICEGIDELISKYKK